MELLVVLVLTGMLLGSALTLLSTLSRAVAQGTDRWDRMEAVRAVWVVLERELRMGRPGRDWWITSEGILELRAFRGTARVCGPSAEPGVHPVVWRGDRLPLVDGDSLLVLGRDGGWRKAELTRWTEGEVGCRPAGGEREGWMEWMGGGDQRPVLLRLFERGAYSFNQRAFRYARGTGGRQPLTPELFGPDSRFYAESDGVRVELDVASDLRVVAGAARRVIRFRIPPAEEGDR